MASLLHHLCLLLPFLPLSIFAQNNRNISQGDSFTAKRDTASWVSSPSGEFAFGFYRLPVPDTQLFLLAIWFDQIPEKTVVWFANRTNPVQRGSKVELTNDGSLVLYDHRGNVAWRAGGQISGRGRATSAAMRDTGEFVLTDISQYIWGSFLAPTDTILPDQVLELNSELRSRLTDTDFSIGRFMFRLLPGGNLVLRTISLNSEHEYEDYYSSGTDGYGYQLVFNQSGYIYIERRNEGPFNLTQPTNMVSYTGFYQRATLDSDGVFRQYIYPKEYPNDGGWKQAWTVMLSLPPDICNSGDVTIGSGICGFNSYCELDEDQRPVCKCPPGYSYLDQKYTFYGCKQDFAPQSCESGDSDAEKQFELKEMPYTNWPQCDYECLSPVNEDECREYCMNDCLCDVAVFSGTQCWKKKIPLSNGRRGRETRGKVLIKVAKSNHSSIPSLFPPDVSQRERDQSTKILIGSLLLGSSLFLNFLFLSAISVAVFFLYNRRELKHKLESSSFGMNLRSFTYKELEQVTDGRLDLLVENGQDALSDARRLERFVMVALWCIQDEPSLRPTMKTVTQIFLSCRILPAMSSHSNLLFLFLALLPLSSIAQTSNNISLGASLSSADENAPWVLSPNGDFAFGFYRLLDKKDLFLLAIWYAKIPQNTVIWSANGDNPVQKGSKVELTSDGELVLNDHQGQEIWKPSPQAVNASNGRVTSAAMLDTGNFVLKGSLNISYFWQTFNEPTDTILPTQVLEFSGKLSSRLTESNFSNGRFQLRLLNDGNLVLNTIGFPTERANDAYYVSNTYGSGFRVLFNESGYISILRRDGSLLNITQTSTGSPMDFYYRATLDFDGVFRQYRYPKPKQRNGETAENWSIISSIPRPTEICRVTPSKEGSGICGFNSYCRVGNNEERHTCECPDGYSFFDPNDKYKGCKQDHAVELRQACDLDKQRMGDVFEMIPIENTNWPLSDSELLTPYDEAQCSKACLEDCLCAVAISGGGCWKKKLPLSNGRMDPGEVGKALIKVLKQDRTQAGKRKKDQGSLILAGSILLGCSAFLNFLFLLGIPLSIYFSFHKKLLKAQPDSSMLAMNLRSFTYMELEEMTDGFKEELGRGSFATNGRLDMLVDHEEEALNDARKLNRLVMVAIWCIQEEPSLRPSMKKVTEMIEGAVEVAVPPDPSSFISKLLGRQLWSLTIWREFEAVVIEAARAEAGAVTKVKVVADLFESMKLYELRLVLSPRPVAAAIETGRAEAGAVTEATVEAVIIEGIRAEAGAVTEACGAL
ncbi:G-type lectin S-receptor-like serine/threonine-protein kinase RLK1 [Cinnamomum micranthum f. kanehirae]|uniref:G-type lectin S-receptor-like serine/threonine-protein kinase RLK1 n=1 Tax=Cinnamomum micranthum f. kanehirae TaxID=337451 RepID=A0A443NH44_9MAGN|nr:G-type lectin S-receptor-like serine/threonine-protein kinase RLK1 [Cinnamomum micranthum f. kanehirae]